MLIFQENDHTNNTKQHVANILYLQSGPKVLDHWKLIHIVQAIERNIETGGGKG